MTKTEALKKLNTLLKELEELPSFKYEGDNSLFDKWERKALSYIEEIFENKKDQSTKFCEIEFEYKPNGFLSPEYRDQVFSDYHTKQRIFVKGLIEFFIEDVNEWENTPQEKVILEINHFIKSSEILTLEDNFKRFNVNENFDKFKLKLEMFLKNTFGKNSDEFDKFKKIRFLYTGPRGMEGLQVPLDVLTYKDGLKSTKILLEIIKENINEHSSTKVLTTTLTTISEAKENISNKVFIVHGHDNGAKQEVARFLEKLGLEPIILHEQANGGTISIIDKIEQYAKQVGFGIVLYTACDEGKAKGEAELKNRARQNVIFEHGYLIGLLGKNRVCSLKKDTIETHSDMSGVVYTSMDDAGAWHLFLAKELKTAGYTIDFNKLM